MLKTNDGPFWTEPTQTGPQWSLSTLVHWLHVGAGKEPSLVRLRVCYSHFVGGSTPHTSSLPFSSGPETYSFQPSGMPAPEAKSITSSREMPPSAWHWVYWLIYTVLFNPQNDPFLRHIRCSVWWCLWHCVFSILLSYNFQMAQLYCMWLVSQNPLKSYFKKFGGR